MAVAGLGVLAVVDSNKQSISALPAGRRNLATRGCPDRSAGRGCEVYSGMFPITTQDGMPAQSKPARQNSFYRLSTKRVEPSIDKIRIRAREYPDGSTSGKIDNHCSGNIRSPGRNRRADKVNCSADGNLYRPIDFDRSVGHFAERGLSRCICRRTRHAGRAGNCQ